jgi:hypothetical protein
MANHLGKKQNKVYDIALLLHNAGVNLSRSDKAGYSFIEFIDQQQYEPIRTRLSQLGYNLTDLNRKSKEIWSNELFENVGKSMRKDEQDAALTEHDGIDDFISDLVEDEEIVSMLESESYEWTDEVYPNE